MSAKQKFTTYVEDADEDTGSVLEGTQRYADSVAPSSPIKEKSNTSKSRRERPLTRRTDSSSPHTTTGLTDSDSTVHPSSSTRKEKEVRIRTKEKERQREKEREQREKDKQRERELLAKKVSMRPPPRHSKTTPVVHSQPIYKRPSAAVDDPQYYGVPTTSTPAPSHSRPRALTARPTSYYGAGSRPPLANSVWYSTPTPSGYQGTPTSYPPQAWASQGGVSYPMPPQQTDYFGHQAYNHPPQNQHLLQRFSRERERPSSSMGFRPTSSSYGFDDYEQENEAPLVRRTSLTRKHAEDRRRMPPPPTRPQSAAPQRQALRPPPPPSSRRTSAYDDDDFRGGVATYQEVAPRSNSYEYKNAMLPTRTRRGSVTYDLPAYTIEPAGTTSRRHSYYGSANANYEDKYQAAAAYQDGVNGGPPLLLTKDALRKAGKRSGGASSRSTRSSESRDESDYRHSATTQTTRSSGDEDITIKVTGQAVLKVAGAEIQCQDGGEINIARQGSTRIGGSDKASSIYDDRRSRAERLPSRTRATSQAGSWSRGQPPPEHYIRGSFI